MNTLYQHFIQQVKRQEIQRYNAKHRDYLIRAGKISPAISNNQNLSKTANSTPNYTNQQRKPRRQRQFQRPSVARRTAGNITNNHEESIQRQATNTRGNQEQALHRPYQEEKNFENQSRIQDSQSYRHQQSRERPIKPANFSYSEELPNENPLERRMKPEAQENQYQRRFQTKNTNQKDKSTNKRVNKREEKPFVKASNNVQEVQQYGEVELVECRQGCGRKFKTDRIDKHEKVCQKVFQEKRKPFEVMKTNEEAEMLKNKDEKANKKQKERERAKEKEDKKQKWKQQSEQLRYAMKKNRGEAVEEPQCEDTRIPCPYCSRKFGETAAARHIQFCKTKSKMKK